jgi:NAD(P)-dependent dehydrogenase (short-subunit alcohol dehydrogenase family)
LKKYGRLDCAFNNAGIEGKSAALAESTEEVWDSVVGVNLKGVWLCMKYELRQMLKQGSGAIVNNASVMGLVASPTNPVYTASKHGVVGLTKSAALAYAQSGIRVNAVCPGYVQTPLVDRKFAGLPERKDAATARQPIGRMGTAKEIAAAVVWLFSDAASFVIGHTLTIDGGYVIQ